MKMQSLKLEKEFRVHVYETGPNGKLNIFSLFNYMQDIASDHAEKLGYGRQDLMYDNKFWVLSRMYAEIKELPLWEDKIILRTWPNGTDKLFALRNYEIYFPDGRPVGFGTSSWLILDMETKRVQRPETLLSRNHLDINPLDFCIRYASKIEAAGEHGDTSRCFSIKASDLDMNLHTNNAVYLKWIIDNYDLGFLMKNDPQSAEINYLAESKHGEEISIRTSPENNNSFNHSVIRSDGKELCRIRMEWKENNLGQV
jgi:acyl-ACP thioesterase